MKIQLIFRAINNSDFILFNLELQHIRLTLNGQELLFMEPVLLSFQSEDENIAAHRSSNRSEENQIIIDDNGFQVDLLNANSISLLARKLGAAKLTLRSQLRGEEQTPILEQFISSLDSLNPALEQLKGELTEQKEKCGLNNLYKDREFQNKMHTGSQFINEILKNERLPESNISEHIDMLRFGIDTLQRILHDIEHSFPALDEASSLVVDLPYKIPLASLVQEVLKTALKAQIDNLEMKINQINPQHYHHQIARCKENITALVQPLINSDELHRVTEQLFSVASIEDSITDLTVLIPVWKEYMVLYNNLVQLAEFSELTLENVIRISDLISLPPRYTQFNDDLAFFSYNKLLAPQTISTLLDTKAYRDKSCLARLTTKYSFFGAATQNEESSKKFWSIYSTAVEDKLSRLITRGTNLSELLFIASTARSVLAHRRNESKQEPNLFGVTRFAHSMKDYYSNDDKSIINSSLFPIVSHLVSRQLDYQNSLNEMELIDESACLYSFKKTNRLSISTATGPIELPDEECTFTFKKVDTQLTLMSVMVQFFPLQDDRFKKMLNHFDQHFLRRHSDKAYSHEEFATELGKLTFFLVRSYPYTRGTGAIIQWVVRALVLNYTQGELSLGDIRLGASNEPSQALPYDVYAHFVQDPAHYAQTFTDQLLELLGAAHKSASAARP